MPISALPLWWGWCWHCNARRQHLYLAPAKGIGTTYARQKKARKRYTPGWYNGIKNPWSSCRNSKNGFTIPESFTFCIVESGAANVENPVEKVENYGKTPTGNVEKVEKLYKNTKIHYKSIHFPLWKTQNFPTILYTI